EAHYEEQQALAGRLATEQPNATEVQFDRFVGLINLGVLYQRTGRPDRAEQATRAALEGLERLVAAHPEGSRYGMSLAVTYQGRAADSGAAGQWAESLDWCDKAVRAAERVLGRSPDDPEALAALLVAQSQRGVSLWELGRLREAAPVFRAGIA